jgi:Rieske Fe-S protein
VPSLGKVGGAAAIVNNDLPGYLIIARTGERDYVVASARYTHRRMALRYDHARKRFKCSSGGGSEFALDGTVLRKPADQPLRIYDWFLEGDFLLIDLPVEHEKS